AGQLDSVNKTYYLTVTITHTNNPSTGQVLTGNTNQTTTTELLHFNGSLLFGSIGTTFNSLSGTPPANAPSGGTIPTTLASVGGFVNLNPGATYSGGPLGVTLDASGNAVVTSGSVTLAQVTDSTARVRFQRGGTLSAAGGSGSFSVTLPT